MGSLGVYRRQMDRDVPYQQKGSVMKQKAVTLFKAEDPCDDLALWRIGP
jgi:hypothetical protein